MYKNGTQPKAIELTAKDILSSISILIKDMTVGGKVDSCSIRDLEVIISTVGKLDVSDVKEKLNYGFTVAIPWFNENILS